MKYLVLFLSLMMSSVAMADVKMSLVIGCDGPKLVRFADGNAVIMFNPIALSKEYQEKRPALKTYIDNFKKRAGNTIGIIDICKAHRKEQTF